MRRNNKKAFTLIELLAVIVILAIIALIAVPVVMNIINKANKSAFKDSAYGIIKAGELYYTDQLLEQDGTVEEKTFTFPNDTVGLEINGSKPTGGTMTVNKDGKISLAITNGKYCVTKGFEDEDVQISDDITNCEVSNGGSSVNTLTDLARNNITFTKVDGTAYDVPTVVIPDCITNKTKCASGTPVAVEVAPEVIYKFYVLNDDTTKNEVTLIMNRNLYSAEDLTNGTNRVEWISESDYGSSPVKNDKGPITALKVLKERTRGWTNIPAYTYTLENDADGEGGSYTYSPITATSTATSIISGENPIQNVRARLPRYSEIYAINNSRTLTNTSWLYENLANTGDNNTNGYWVSTAYSFTSGIVWGVSSSYSGFFNYPLIFDNNFGIRPVITLSK